MGPMYRRDASSIIGNVKKKWSMDKCVTTKRVPLARPRAGLMLRSKIIGMPTLRPSWWGDDTWRLAYNTSQNSIEIEYKDPVNGWIKKATLAEL
jgi:hypothetical protein